MKKLFVCVALSACVFTSVFAQVKHTAPQLSANTRQYLYQVAHGKGKATPLPGYVYKSIGGQPYLSAFIKVNEGMSDASLKSLGVFTGTKAGNIWTVQVPVTNVLPFTKLDGIAYIDLDVPICPQLDAARKLTRADSAQRGINLPMPMTGNGVIVGIIDAGFDFDHPTLYDTLHGAYRVRRVWEQKIAGTPPSGFAYGREMTDSNIIRAAGTDTAITTHGTHVAGIAAGSGYGSTLNSKYRGMAYESELALVGIMPPPSQWAVAGTTDIIDGMNYIYTYAASVSKPCVVNLSWGSSIGPHDGHSLFSQSCDALTGAGKIFACSAGNNGGDTVHLKKTFAATDNTVSTFVTFSPYLDTNNLQNWVDVWGDTGKTFCLNIQLYNGTTVIDSTGLVCIADTTTSYKLVGSDGDTCYVTISTVASEYNGKPHAFVSLFSHVPDNVCLTTTATDGTVNMWQGYVYPPTGYYGAFKKLGYSWAVSGDVNMTVSDISSSFSAISVGAYTSKATFTNISGATLGYPGAVVGKIAPFSSLGPVVDNRVKPDITGPGFALASAISSYDTTYTPTGPNYNAVISNTTIGGRVYPYAMAAGTSMSSPAVSGIIAMMLQMNPTLTPDSVKTIMAITAITDGYTGVLPSSGNNTWGHGKINAYKALKYMAILASVENTLNDNPLDCLLYPNPTKGNFTVTYKSDTHDMASVEIYDITGKLAYSQKWPIVLGYNSKEMSLQGMPKGIYFTKISVGNKYKVIRTVLD